jgi:hypothetical protein
MSKFKMEKLALAGDYVVLRSDVTVMAMTTAEAHARDITDALNGVELAAQRDKWNAINSMSLMFGLAQKSTSLKALVANMQDASGEGFIDALTELAPLALKVTEVELALIAAAQARNEGFPGVFQYEVTEEVGAYVAELLSGSKDCLLDKATDFLGNAALSFMDGCSEEGANVPEYIAAIESVLPDWKRPGALKD